LGQLFVICPIGNNNAFIIWINWPSEISMTNGILKTLCQSLPRPVKNVFFRLTQFSGYDGYNVHVLLISNPIDALLKNINPIIPSNTLQISGTIYEMSGMNLFTQLEPLCSSQMSSKRNQFVHD
jgi:hypothetical protein